MTGAQQYLYAFSVGARVWRTDRSLEVKGLGNGRVFLAVTLLFPAQIVVLIVCRSFNPITHDVSECGQRIHAEPLGLLPKHCSQASP